MVKKFHFTMTRRLDEAKKHKKQHPGGDRALKFPALARRDVTCSTALSWINRKTILIKRVRSLLEEPNAKCSKLLKLI